MDDAPGDENRDRVVIRAPQPAGNVGDKDAAEAEGRAAAPRAAGSRMAGSQADLPMAVAVLGGVLLCFAPLLPWWSQHIGLIQLQTQITGVTTWPGIVCELCGAALVGMCAYMISKPEVELNVSVIAAGVLALVVSSIALLSGKTLLGTAVELTPQVGLYLTIAGAAAGTVGGYLLMRKDPR